MLGGGRGAPFGRAGCALDGTARDRQSASVYIAISWQKRSKWRLLSGPRRRFRAQPAPGRDLYLFLFRSLDDSFFITHMIK